MSKEYKKVYTRYLYSELGILGLLSKRISYEVLDRGGHTFKEIIKGI